jgi:hypothetical protein
MRPPWASWAAARRTGPIKGRQGPSSPAGQGAGDLARADGAVGAPGGGLAEDFPADGGVVGR